MISDFSALDLWRFDVPGDPVVHLWTPRRLRHENVKVRQGDIEQADIRVVDGIRVTSVPRTLIDVAGTVSEEQLEALVEDALYRGLTTPAAIERRLAAIGGKGRLGSGRLRAVLASRGDGAALESRLEVRVWQLLRRVGLRPVRQYRVRYGDQAYRLDFAWPALRVGIEADGYASHGGRRAFSHDRQRLADLVGHDWRIIPVTWDLINDHPEKFIEMVRGALGAAASCR